MNARDSYRFGFDLESGASVAAKSVTLPEDSGGPLMRKVDVFPQRRPDRQNIIGQAAGYSLGRPVEIVIHREQSVGFELAKHPPQFLLDSIYGVKEIPAIHVEFPAAQLPIRAQEKVIPEDTIFHFCQHAFADEAKICDILLILPPPMRLFGPYPAAGRA